jgi:hypothetical protein
MPSLGGGSTPRYNLMRSWLKAKKSDMMPQASGRNKKEQAEEKEEAKAAQAGNGAKRNTKAREDECREGGSAIV